METFGTIWAESRRNLHRVTFIFSIYLSFVTRKILFKFEAKSVLFFFFFEVARESTDSGWHSLYISRPPSKAAPCYRCTGTMHFLPPRRPPFFQRFILFSVLSLVVFFSPSLPPSLSSLIPLITAPFVPGWMQPCTAASTTMERATQNVINIEIERSRRGSSTRPAINPPPPSRIWFKPIWYFG